MMADAIAEINGNAETHTAKVDPSVKTIFQLI